MASAGPMPFAALVSDSARSRSRRARRGDGIGARDLGDGSVPAAVRHSCASQIKDTGFSPDAVNSVAEPREPREKIHRPEIAGPRGHHVRIDLQALADRVAFGSPSGAE
jgi:hypothetical protein